MSEINKIYEITQKLSSPDNAKNDIREAIELLSKHFTAKYLSPINVALASHKQYCTNHPTKEINLLNAFKPFISNSEILDRLIDAFNYYRLINDLKIGETGIASAAQLEDSAIHSDGIYEVDEGCMGANTQSLPYNMQNESIFILILILLLNR